MKLIPLLLLLSTHAQDGQREPLVAPEVPAEPTAVKPSLITKELALRFEEADFESRWHMWKTEIADDAAKRTAWVEWLTEHEFYEVLEWHTLTTNDWLGTGGALASANAPQWLRVALHLHHSTDSHTFDNAKARLEKHPDLVLSWLERFPERLNGTAQKLYESLRGSDTPRVDASLYLPPYADRELFGALEPVSTPVKFTGEFAAQPGVDYTQQTLRSIDALVMTDVRAERWMKALLRLTKNKNEEVRRAALVAYSHFPAEEIPTQEFLELVQSEKEAPGIRAAALVAFSYGPDFPVVAELLTILENPQHPAWSVAVTRLGDLGDGLIANQFDRINLADLDDARVSTLGIARGNALSRVPSNGQIEATTLRRIAWARATEHPLADRLERDGLEVLRASVDATILARIVSDGVNWEPRPWLSEEVELKIRTLYRNYTDQISQ